MFLTSPYIDQAFTLVDSESGRRPLNECYGDVTPTTVTLVW